MAFADAGAWSPASISTPRGRGDRATRPRQAAARNRGRCDVSLEDECRPRPTTVLRHSTAMHILVNAAARHDPNGDGARPDAAAVEPGVRRQCRGRLPHEPRGAAVDDRGRRRQHHPYRLAAWQRRAPGRAAYCASKGALIQLAKAMAVDHAAQKSASTRSRPARSRPSGWCCASATWKPRAASPGPSTCSTGSASRMRSRQAAAVSRQRCGELHDRRRHAGRRRLQHDVVFNASSSATIAEEPATPDGRVYLLGRLRAMSAAAPVLSPVFCRARPRR